MDLDTLALLCGTDKSSEAHHYTEAYEPLFEPLRQNEIVLVELGVDRGQSMRLWADYFRSGVIVGVDNFAGGDPRPQLKHLRNVHIFESDQADPALALLLLPYGPLDIVIDDCSHIAEKTVASFHMLWPMLKPGGLYIIEDIGAQPDRDDVVLQTIQTAAHVDTITLRSSRHPDVPHFSVAIITKADHAY